MDIFATVLKYKKEKKTIMKMADKEILKRKKYLFRESTLVQSHIHSQDSK